MSVKLKQESGQITRFSIVGGLSVATYYMVFVGLVELFQVWYLLSAVVAFVGYFVVNFTLQKYWAFKNTDSKSVARQLRDFTFMAVINWCVNTGLLYLAVERFGFHYLLTQIVLTVVVSIIAYFGLRWIFRSEESF
jgi:putative flippase GtrA